MQSLGNYQLPQSTLCPRKLCTAHFNLFVLLRVVDFIALGHNALQTDPEKGEHKDGMEGGTEGGMDGRREEARGEQGSDCEWQSERRVLSF